MRDLELSTTCSADFHGRTDVVAMQSNLTVMVAIGSAPRPAITMRGMLCCPQWARVTIHATVLSCINWAGIVPVRKRGRKAAFGVQLSLSTTARIHAPVPLGVSGQLRRLSLEVGCAA